MIVKKVYLSFIVILNFIPINSTAILIDNLFKSLDICYPVCSNKSREFSRYRGEIINFEDIQEKIINDSNYLFNMTTSYVYFSSEELLNNNINYIPMSTIIFTNFNIESNEKIQGFCYIQMKHALSKHHYMIITDKELEYINFPLFIIILYIFFFRNVCMPCFESSFELGPFENLYFQRSIKFLLFGSIPLVVSAISLYYLLLSHIIYSLYKSYLFISFIILLEGFSIIHMNDIPKVFFKQYYLIVFLFDALISILGEYICYFAPNIDNFYIFLSKNIIEHATFLGFLTKFYYSKFINIHKQYLIERRLHTLLEKTYKIKRTLYLKVMVFSIVYCGAFMILPLIEKLYIKIDKYVEAFYFNYFLMICIELLFCSLLRVTLPPFELPIYFFLPTIFDYNTFKLEAKIKNKNNRKFNISNLKYDLLKDEYQEKEYPLILLNPIAKTDNVFLNLQFHVGLIKKAK